MRADVQKHSFGDYKFVLEFDSGGDPEVPYTLWIYKEDGKMLYYKDSDRQVRRDFPKNYNKQHLVNFCKKFASDENYRNDYCTL
ncbi:hypothetical protein [Desulfosporosinus sp. FKB]|uniref:hypothetical protein n=1 Tax=Desulfosporosinus sp. FKB TaxID=1969835 RepID=UPI000B499DB0|nr:hypothetical protein [Desulfosporosinus sp. FKB]